MRTKTELEAIAARMMRTIPADRTGKQATAIPGFHLARWKAAGELCEVYEPFIGLTVQGGWLRAICAGGAVVNRVAEAVSRIRADYKSPLSVPDLAKSVGMSESSFFRTFREVTGASPLQFQKTLRLYEAQRLIFTRVTNVENAAYAVGYASATQFAREYRRLFGAPPKKDVTRMRGE